MHFHLADQGAWPRGGGGGANDGWGTGWGLQECGVLQRWSQSQVGKGDALLGMCAGRGEFCCRVGGQEHHDDPFFTHDA